MDSGSVLLFVAMLVIGFVIVVKNKFYKYSSSDILFATKLRVFLAGLLFCLIGVYGIVHLSINYIDAKKSVAHYSLENPNMNVRKGIMQIERFIQKDKFLEDSSGSYPGISNPKLRKPLTDIINRSAEEFIEVLTDEPSDIKFRNTIKMGLEKFERYKRSLDSRDKDRIVNYYKELMDLVGLDDSGGHLEGWSYEFVL